MRSGRFVLCWFLLTMTLAGIWGSTPTARAQPDSEKPERTLAIYHLRHTQPQAVAEIISKLLVAPDDPRRGDGDVKPAIQIAVDERTNSLIVSGLPDENERVAALIEALDVPGDWDATPRDLAAYLDHKRLLFYWLATGPEFATKAGIPQQLQPVVNELERLGLENLQLVSRSVAGLDGERVSVNSKVNAADRTFHLEFQAIVDTRDDAQTARQRAVDLSVQVVELNVASATGGGDLPSPQRCSLEATVRMPNDHFVVLGVTGLGDLENAFVIQIQSDKPAKEGERANPSQSKK